MEPRKDFLKKTGYMYSKKTDKAWSELHERMGQEGISGPDRGLSTSWGVRIAAILVLLLAMAWGIREIVNTKTEKVETALSQQQVILPDGSTVFLNGNSTLEFPRTFGPKNRIVRLSGEAFFKVTKNLIKPFIVETRSARIKVLGTSFNVLTSPDNNRVEVLVKTGVVSLSSRHNRKERLFLVKGDFGIVDSGKTKRATAPGKNYLAWQTKKFQFNNEKLINVVETLNHAYATRILLGSDSIQQLHLTSTFNQVSLDTVVRSLCLTFHLIATQNNDEIILSTGH